MYKCSLGNTFIYAGVAQSGRAVRCQREGREFESHLPLQGENRMEIVPDNGYLYVREIETPRYSPVSGGTICGSEWQFGNVLDFAEDLQCYLDTNIMFLRAAAISLRVKNDEGRIENRYLVRADDVVASLGE